MIPPLAWAKIGSGALGLLKELWPILLLIVATLFVAHQFYYGPRMDNLKLELSVCERDNERFIEVIEDQSQQVTNLSETSKQVSEEFIESLEEALSNMTEDNRQVIESILDAGVPEGCDESRQFLIDMIQNLQWEQREP